jgi:hypothetical protein
VYWRPVFHALTEIDGFEILLCNAHHVKNVPGRRPTLPMRCGWHSCVRSGC